MRVQRIKQKPFFQRDVLHYALHLHGVQPQFCYFFSADFRVGFAGNFVQRLAQVSKLGGVAVIVKNADVVGRFVVAALFKLLRNVNHRHVLVVVHQLVRLLRRVIHVFYVNVGRCVQKFRKLTAIARIIKVNYRHICFFDIVIAVNGGKQHRQDNAQNNGHLVVRHRP